MGTNQVDADYKKKEKARNYKIYILSQKLDFLLKGFTSAQLVEKGWCMWIVKCGKFKISCLIVFYSRVFDYIIMTFEQISISFICMV